MLRCLDTGVTLALSYYLSLLFQSIHRAVVLDVSPLCDVILYSPGLSVCHFGSERMSDGRLNSGMYDWLSWLGRMLNGMRVIVCPRANQNGLVPASLQVETIVPHS